MNYSQFQAKWKKQTIFHKKHKIKYEEATYDKLLKKLKNQLEILKFEQNL